MRRKTSITEVEDGPFKQHLSNLNLNCFKGKTSTIDFVEIKEPDARTSKCFVFGSCSHEVVPRHE